LEQKNKRQVGTEYETIATDYLKKKGYQIIERNHRNRMGEIDILAEKNGVLVVVEVKYRKNGSCGDPLEAVNWQKQRRICKTILYYFMIHGYGMEKPCRFDVIGIYGDGTIKHVENAFEFQG
jgi:putative endonuclease